MRWPTRWTIRAAAVSGVNLDEEMARMVQLQQAYSAAARLITVTDELFDELLGIVEVRSTTMLTRIGDFAQST